MAKGKGVNFTMMVICPPLIVWEPSWSRPRPWLVLLTTHFRGPKDSFAESMSINGFVRPSSEQKKCEVYVAVASWYFQGFPLSYVVYIRLTSRTSHNAFGWWRTVSWCRSVCWPLAYGELQSRKFQIKLEFFYIATLISNRYSLSS